VRSAVGVPVAQLRLEGHRGLGFRWRAAMRAGIRAGGLGGAPRAGRPLTRTPSVVAQHARRAEAVETSGGRDQRWRCRPFSGGEPPSASVSWRTAEHIWPDPTPSRRPPAEPRASHRGCAVGVRLDRGRTHRGSVTAGPPTVSGTSKE
jgi:hypothetical protein